MSKSKLCFYTNTVIIIAVLLTWCLVFLPISAMLDGQSLRCSASPTLPVDGGCNNHSGSCDCGSVDHAAIVFSSSHGSLSPRSAIFADIKVLFPPVFESPIFRPPLYC